jgi:hypothetical protein
VRLLERVRQRSTRQIHMGSPPCTWLYRRGMKRWCGCASTSGELLAGFHHHPPCQHRLQNSVHSPLARQWSRRPNSRLLPPEGPGNSPTHPLGQDHRLGIYLAGSVHPISGGRHLLSICIYLYKIKVTFYLYLSLSYIHRYLCIYAYFCLPAVYLYLSN